MCRRPQSEIMGNLYRETRRKLELEDALGATLEEARLGRLLLIDPVTAVPLFHYVLPGRNTVGKARGQVDICLASKACSKQHACLEVREGVCLLSDLGSTNGTAVNGERVTLRRLEDGDQIALGGTTRIEFRAG